jgi:hypothetical protein
MPRSISDLVRTFEDRFRVGKSGGGAKSFELFNGFLGRLLWSPTANRDIVVPDASGTIVLQNSGRIDGLQPAIAPGQALTFEQAASSVMPQDSGLFAQVSPGSGTSLIAAGTSIATVIGSVSHPVLTATNYLTQTRRWLTTSAATAGSLSAHRQNAALFWRGNAAGRGGFKCTLTAGLEVLAAGQRGFFGISDSLSAPTNVDPLTTTANNKIGLAFANNTGNWQIIWNAAGTAPTVTDLGANFPINITDLIELTVSCDPNGAGYQWTVKNLATGAISSGLATTNIPLNTVFMAPYMWMTNNLTAATIAFSSTGWKATPPTILAPALTTGYVLFGSVSVPSGGAGATVGTITLPAIGLYALLLNVQSNENINAGNYFQVYANNIKAISDTGGGSTICAPGIVCPIVATTNNFVVTVVLFHLNTAPLNSGTLTTKAGSTAADGSSATWIRIG